MLPLKTEQKERMWAVIKRVLVQVSFSLFTLFGKVYGKAFKQLILHQVLFICRMILLRQLRQQRDISDQLPRTKYFMTIINFINDSCDQATDNQEVICNSAEEAE